MLAIQGCGGSVSLDQRALPAPISDEDSYEMVGRVRRMWGGDNFEFGEVERLHYVVIRGVDSPKPGQVLFNQSRSYAWNMVNGGRRVRIEVNARDDMMREVGDVFVINPDPADIRGEINVGLETIRGGYGWYSGEEFDGSKEYKEAEASARESKLGLWATGNPTPPWEFEAQRQEQRRKRLNQQAATVSGDE